MSVRLSSAKWSLVLILVLSHWFSLRAQQQPTFLVPLDMIGKAVLLRGYE